MDSEHFPIDNFGRKIGNPTTMAGLECADARDIY
jgi:hypothetical protein